MKLFILPFFLLCLQTTLAQKSKPEDYQKAIHFSPLALLQIDYTLMIGGEYRTRPNFAWVMEAGYIFASSYMDDFETNSPGSGFIIRPSIRWYVGNKSRFYLQPQLYYKMVTHKKYDWVGRDCVDEVSSYEELVEFKYRRHISGANATIGWIVPLGRSGKRFVDFYLGMGFKYKKSVIVDHPGSCFTPPNILMTTTDPDNGFFPNLPAGVKLIFSIQ
ncbi:MAG: hypothetical protein ACXWCZ_00455 [Flavisolibacter sp.]